MTDDKSKPPERKHRLFLNPYTLHRFTRCPETGEPTKTRQMPMLVMVYKPEHEILHNFEVKYSPGADLMILHLDRTLAIIRQMLDLHPRKHLDLQFVVAGIVKRAYFHSDEVQENGFDGRVFENTTPFEAHMHYQLEDDKWVGYSINPMQPPWTLSAPQVWRWQVKVHPIQHNPEE